MSTVEPLNPGRTKRRSLTCNDALWDLLGRGAERLGYNGRGALLRDLAGQATSQALKMDPAQALRVAVRVKPV